MYPNRKFGKSEGKCVDSERWRVRRETVYPSEFDGYGRIKWFEGGWARRLSDVSAERARRQEVAALSKRRCSRVKDSRGTTLRERHSGFEHAAAPCRLRELRYTTVPPPFHPSPPTLYKPPSYSYPFVVCVEARARLPVPACLYTFAYISARFPTLLAATLLLTLFSLPSLSLFLLYSSSILHSTLLSSFCFSFFFFFSSSLFHLHRLSFRSSSLLLFAVGFLQFLRNSFYSFSLQLDFCIIFFLFISSALSTSFHVNFAFCILCPSRSRRCRALRDPSLKPEPPSPIASNKLYIKWKNWMNPRGM